MGDATTYVYQFISDENKIHDTNVIQYFIINVLVICIKFDCFVAHVFYVLPFSPNTAVPIDKKKQCFISMNTYTIVFS